MAGEGDCDGDQECEAGLVCGDNNCRQVSGQSEARTRGMDQSEASDLNIFLFCSLEHSSMKRTTVV